jgi:hypothetical protein
MSSLADHNRALFPTWRLRSGNKRAGWSFLHGLLLVIGVLANAWAVDYPVGQFGSEYYMNGAWRAQPRITNDKAEAWRSPTQNLSVANIRFGRSVTRTEAICGTYSVTVGVKAGTGTLSLRGNYLGSVTNNSDTIVYQPFTFVLYQGETAQIDLNIQLNNGAAYAGGSLYLNPVWAGMSNPTEAVSPTDLFYAVESDYATTSWHRKTWTPTPTYLNAQIENGDSPSLWRSPATISAHKGGPKFISTF